MSELFGNPEDRFSCVAAHIAKIVCNDYLGYSMDQCYIKTVL